MQPKNRYFHVFDHLDVVGGVPVVVVDAPTLAEAVAVYREFDQKMVPGETAIVDSPGVGHFVTCARSLSRRSCTEDQTNTFSVYHVDFDEDQVIWKNPEDGRIYWVSEDGTTKLVE